MKCDNERIDKFQFLTVYINMCKPQEAIHILRKYSLGEREFKCSRSELSLEVLSFKCSVFNRRVCGSCQAATIDRLEDAPPPSSSPQPKIYVGVVK